jgi:hypothetical protein
MLSHLSRKDETRGRTRSSVGTVTHSWRGTSWESIWQDAPVGSSGGVESNNRSGHLGPWTPLGAGLLLRLPALEYVIRIRKVLRSTCARIFGGPWSGTGRTVNSSFCSRNRRLTSTNSRHSPWGLCRTFPFRAVVHLVLRVAHRALKRRATLTPEKPLLVVSRPHRNVTQDQLVSVDDRLDLPDHGRLRRVLRIAL